MPTTKKILRAKIQEWLQIHIGARTKLTNEVREFVEKNNIVVTDIVLGEQGSSEKIAALIPGLPYIPKERQHTKRANKETKILKIIRECLPFQPKTNTLATIKKHADERYEWNLKSIEILTALRKTTQLKWSIDQNGYLHVEIKNAALADRIRTALKASKHPLSRQELEKTLLETIPTAKLHYVLKNDPTIIRIGRNLFATTSTN